MQYHQGCAVPPRATTSKTDVGRGIYDISEYHNLFVCRDLSQAAPYHPKISLNECRIAFSNPIYHE
jgi:hypothetical protein